MNGRSGGPAALGGFLYQLIMHLDWVERLVVSIEKDTHRLVLEPRNGGDAHIQHNGKRIIEQYKTREGAGTWSIREIVHGPFVDFARAARIRKSDSDEFRFVTDGRVNHHESLLSFLKRIAECTKNGKPLEQQKIYAYGSIGEFTDPTLFDWIHKEIQSRFPKGNVLDAATLGHVLSRVKLNGGVKAHSTELRLDALLRGCLADPTKAGAVRDQLIGRLLTLLADGSVDIDPKEFLRINGIDVDRAQRMADRCHGLAIVLRTVVARGFSRYRPEHDVRRPPQWDLNASPILAIAGPPGVGKTWQLISLALDLVDRDMPCVFQSLQSDVPRSLDLAAETYWNDVLKTPTTIGISALKNAIKEATRNTRGLPDPGPWLVALLDGPLSPGDLRALIDEVAQDDEIRIAITVPLDVAERLRDDHGSVVQVVEITQFTPSELMAYFDLFGVEWKQLPIEMFTLLQLPLLASLFVRSGHTSYSVSPDSEYGLLELFWKKLGVTTGASVLRELSRYVFAHPAQRACALEYALPTHDRATLDELKNAGWIDMDHDAHVQFAHDRLLNWALADAIVTDASCGQMDENDLPTKLRLTSAQNTRFGYLLMDVFWKLTSMPRAMGSAIKLLSQIETETYDIHSLDFYQHLLPTLGAHALDLLAARKAAADLDPPNIHLVMSAVRAIGRQFVGRASAPAISRYAREWIGKSRGTWTDIGLALAEEACLTDLIEDIKAVHFSDIQAMRSDFATHHSNYEASFAALKACVSKRHDWLRDQIQSSRDPEELNALAYQLLNLEHPSAFFIWETCRNTLAGGTDSARGMLLCIRRFRDWGLVDYIVNALGSSNSNSASIAFCVLATIAPDHALAQLDRLEQSELYMWRNEWVAELHAARPRELEAWLQRTLGDGHWQHEVFGVFSNNASSSLIEAVVDHFARQVAQRTESDNPWLGSWARILSALSVRAQTQHLAGSGTETALVKIAKRRIDPKRRWYDHLLEDARAILLAIGGTGIQELLAYELQITRGKFAHRALKWAPLVAWPGIESALASHVATKDADVDADDRLISNHDAIVGLVALDAHDELERTLLTSAIRGFPLNALTLREGQPPFPPATIERIQSALAQASALDDAQLVQQLILAALAQADELAPTIERVLLQRDPATQTVFVHGAHAALQYSVSESLALWSQQWLPNKETRRLAIALHLKCGSDACYRHLLGYAREIAATARDLAADIVARLPSSGESGAATDALAIEIFHAADYAVGCYRRVARCGGSVEREKLRQRAYQADASFLNLRRSAIASLATIDPLDAARAALWLAEQVAEQESFAADVVIRFGSDDHFLQLIGVCHRLERQSLWDHVGRAFRQRAAESRGRLLRDLGSRDEISFRRAFAELAGWLGEAHRAVLLARVAVENSRPVHKALRVALRRVDELAALKATLATLDGAQGIKAAALLHTVLAANEPFLLSDPDDDLYVGKVLNQLPKYFRFFAMERLSDLRKNFKPSES